jgi:hypothetical protein
MKIVLQSFNRAWVFLWEWFLLLAWLWRKFFALRLGSGFWWGKLWRFFKRFWLILTGFSEFWKLFSHLLEVMSSDIFDAANFTIWLIWVWNAGKIWEHFS